MAPKQALGQLPALRPTIFVLITPISMSCQWEISSSFAPLIHLIKSLSVVCYPFGMEKDFAKWNELKTRLQRKKNQFVFNGGDIWFCSLGLNLGHEEDGKGDVFLRPVVILKKINNDTFLAIPLTTKEKIGNRYYSFDFGEKRVTAILAQVRLLDGKRLWRKKGVMAQTQFFEMMKKFKALFP
jgi:mRNA-degrading endonuclease toxin of MazEF toxin-antitoxin module